MAGVAITATTLPRTFLIYYKEQAHVIDDCSSIHLCTFVPAEVKNIAHGNYYYYF